MHYPWPELGQQEGSVTSARLADQVRLRLGLPSSLSLAAARDAALAELLAAARLPEFNVESFGAVAGLSADSAWAINDAIEAASAAGGGIVYLPSPLYSIADAEIKAYSNVVLEGRSGGGHGGTVATQLYQGAAAPFKLLSSSDPNTTINNFEMRNITFSAFGNTLNAGGLDFERFHGLYLSRVAVSGAQLYGMRFKGGAAGGQSGFSSLIGCVLASLAAGASGLLFEGTTEDQPDGIDIYNLYATTAAVFLEWRGVASGHAAQSIRFHGGSLEANSASLIECVLSDAFGMGADFFGTRFENTGAGGLKFTFNGVNSQPPARFHGGHIAPGAGGVTWVDSGFVPVSTFGLEIQSDAPDSDPTSRTTISTLVLPEFTLTDAATIVVPGTRAGVFGVTLTDNRTMGAPTGLTTGQRITFHIRQDGTGGHTLAWNAIYRHAWADTGNTADKESTITFRYDGTSLVQVGAQGPYV